MKGQHGTGGQFGKTEKQEIFELHWMNNVKKKLNHFIGKYDLPLSCQDLNEKIVTIYLCQMWNYSQMILSLN